MSRVKHELVSKIQIEENEKKELGQFSLEKGYFKHQIELKFFLSKVKPEKYLELIKNDPKPNPDEFLIFCRFNFPNVYYKLIEAYFEGHPKELK